MICSKYFLCVSSVSFACSICTILQFGVFCCKVEVESSFLLCILGECVSHVLPSRKVLWGPNKYGHWLIQGKCVSDY